ncbi:MAG: response regulator [Bdellovibrionales bacterium]|nr:response regulator [Bdellovibrionales bacterium]
MKKILIVDDEPYQLIFMKKAVESLGHSVETASTASDALAKSGGADVVLSDLRMPDMTGPELLRKIREISPRVGTILVTAQQSNEVIVDALKNGADDFIQKPVEFGMLEVVLSRIIRIREILDENERLKAGKK